MTLLALGAVPLVADAQQARIPTVGILGIINLEPTLGPFREAMRDLGYVEGKNVRFEIRSANGDASAGVALAEDLVRRNVDVIVAYQTPAVKAAKQATATIPIVMAAGDAVESGLIASLARPGGNVTGMSNSIADLAAKTLSLVKEIRPAVRVVAVLANAADPFTAFFLSRIQSAGQALAIDVRPAMVGGPDDYDGVFAAWALARIDAVIVQPSLPFKHALELAGRHRMLSASSISPFVEAGGLFAYAPNVRGQSRKLAAYVDRILKGAKPGDLPAEQPTEFVLAINLKTAKSLQVTIPKSLLARADAVIQ